MESPFINLTNAYIDDATDPPMIIVALRVDESWHTYRMTREAAGDFGAHLGLLADD